MLDEPTDEENDMLDLAFGLSDTYVLTHLSFSSRFESHTDSCRSRLGCQVILSPELEGMEVILPSATRNMAVDGFKPKPH